MGIFHTIDINIRGQIKPMEDGNIAEKEIELICAKYGLELDNQSGCCRTYREDEEWNK